MTKSLREAAQQALEALAGYRREVALLTDVLDKQPCDAEIALRAALDQEYEDWSRVEALEAALREHMAEIHRLRAALEQGKYLLSVERDATAAELRRLHAEIEEWRAKAAAWIASPEAAQRLEGYRELAQMAERAETESDALRAELREATEATDDCAVNNLRTLPESIRMLRAERDELLEALTRYVHHFGDPLKCARAAIAKATGGAT